MLRPWKFILPHRIAGLERDIHLQGNQFNVCLSGLSFKCKRLLLGLMIRPSFLRLVSLFFFRVNLKSWKLKNVSKDTSLLRYPLT